MTDTKGSPKAVTKTNAPYLERPEARYLTSGEAQHRARLDYWLLWEAMLLATGFSPTFYEQLASSKRRRAGPITEEAAFAAIHRSPLEEASEEYSPDPWENGADQWWDMREVIKRSDRFPGARVKPAEFLAWAEEKGFAVHEGLKKAVAQFSGELPKWGYGAAPPPAALEPTPDETNDNVPDGDDLHPKTKRSLFILVATMAVEGYKYDPTSERNSAVARIEQHAERLGLKISDDTVRRRLSEACELIDWHAVKTENKKLS